MSAPQEDMRCYAILTLRSMLCEEPVQSMSLSCKHLRGPKTCPSAQMLCGRPASARACLHIAA